MPTQTSFSSIAALIVDDMAVQQTTLRGQLAMLGIGKVDQATTADEAIRLIRSRAYGLVLCDFNLNQKTDGQQLFEYLRDENLLPADCLFFMVTAESAYASVASATEHKPDAYLLKPITAGDIEERLKMLLEKRSALLPINEKLNRQDPAGAVAECDKALLRKDRWFMQVLQIKGRTLMQLGHHDEAKAVYRMALEQRSQLIWAQLGLARAYQAASQFEEAKSIAYDIIQSKEGEKTVAAYDVVAESMEAQGDSQGALWVLRDSATVVPSARRYRLVGESAYRNGDLETAKECFQKVAKATKGSVIAQPQDMLLLAQTLVDRGEAAEAMRLLADGAASHRNDPLFDNVAPAIRAQAQVKAGDTAGAGRTMERARANLRKPKADFATIALAKAELMSGNEEAGLALMERAISTDLENPRVQQMIRNALGDTGHEDKLDQIMAAAEEDLMSQLKAAKGLFRDSRIDEALAAIENVVRDHPGNTTVLLQAAQMSCMSLRLKKAIDSTVNERVQLYLASLERLLPANDRVIQMQRYYRETLSAIKPAGSPSPTPQPASALS